VCSLPALVVGVGFRLTDLQVVIVHFNQPQSQTRFVSLLGEVDDLVQTALFVPLHFLVFPLRACFGIPTVDGLGVIQSKLCILAVGIGFFVLGEAHVLEFELQTARLNAFEQSVD